MTPDEWDLRVALKQYEGEVDAQSIHNTLANHLNGPFFTCKKLADESVQAVVQKTWWQFELVNHEMFAHDGREYLGHLMDLAGSWRRLGHDARLSQSQQSLLRYNSALVMMCVTGVLGADD
jgi:hypothetical protein